MKKSVYTGWGYCVKDAGEMIAVPDCDLSLEQSHTQKEFTLTKDSDLFNTLLTILKDKSSETFLRPTQIERVQGIFVKVELSTSWSEWVYGVDEEDCLDELDSRYNIFGNYF